MINFYNDLLDSEKKYFKIVEYNAFDVIFNERDVCNHLGIVLKGEVLISTITYNEKEEVINTIKEHDVFGDILLFASNNIYLGDVIAIKKSIVALITKDNLLKLLTQRKELLTKYLCHLSNKSLNIKLQSKLLSHKNIEDRIMYFLSTVKNKDNIYEYKSITDIANKLSLPRPSVSRSMTILENKGLIKKEKKKIYIL